jgi:hypothetical protein
MALQSTAKAVLKIKSNGELNPYAFMVNVG